MRGKIPPMTGVKAGWSSSRCTNDRVKIIFSGSIKTHDRVMGLDKVSIYNLFPAYWGFPGKEYDVRSVPNLSCYCIEHLGSSLLAGSASSFMT